MQFMILAPFYAALAIVIYTSPLDYESKILTQCICEPSSLLSSVIHVADSQRIFSKGIHEYLFSNPNASHLHSNPQNSQSIQIGKKVVKLSLVTVMVVYVENPMEYKNKTTRKLLEFCMVTGHSQ